MIAESLAIEVKPAALLSSAFTFPYAFVQPVLGIIGDSFGKTRLMNVCLLVVALSGLVCAVATSFSLLVAMRVVAGAGARGAFSGGNGASGRFGADGSAPSRDRAAARGCTRWESGGCLDLGSDWRPVRLARCLRSAEPVLFWGSDCGLLRAPRGRATATGVIRPRRGAREFPQHLRRPTRQGVLRVGFFRGHLHPRPLSICGTAAGRERRGTRLHRRAFDCHFRHRRRALFVFYPTPHHPVPGASADAPGGHLGWQRSDTDRAASTLDLASGHLRRVRVWLLSSARVDPGACDRSVADGARDCRLVAFLILLHGPGAWPGDLWLWFCPWRD